MSNRMQQEFAHRDGNSQVRLNKYLSEAGVCSRREADRLIESGKVTVDGGTAVTGMKILPGQDIRVQGQPLSREKEMVLLAVNKPVGVVCTTDKRWGMKRWRRCFPIQRGSFRLAGWTRTQRDFCL